MIHVHIGRHKTGTSALQWFLHDNRERLARAGFIYPDASDGRIAHHGLAISLDPKRRRSAAAETLAAAVADTSRVTELSRSGANVVLSSEGFQNIDPISLYGLLRGMEARIVVYLREPLDYLLSSYAQMVQARADRIPFADYAVAFKADYKRFLDRWAKVFGPENLDVRLYDRDVLEGGDVRRDFLTALGLDGDGFMYREGRTNPSLGAELIEFKGAVNLHMAQADQARLKIYNHLARAAPHFAKGVPVSPEFQERFRARARPSNTAALEAYAGVAGFREKDFSGPVSVVDIDAVADRVVGLIADRAPRAAKRLAEVLPKHLNAAPRLLPEDWAEAAGRL